MKFVFLGDSLTWGGYGGNFVPLVADALPEHQMINAGVGGDTVVNLLRRLDAVLEQHQPDAVFVMVGGNDATSYSMPLTRPYYKKSKGLETGFVSPDEFISHYRDLLLHLQLKHILTFVGLAPTEYNRELVQVKRAYNQATQALADSLKIPVLDLDTPFTPSQPIDRAPVDIAFIQQIGTRASQGWTDFENERQKWGYYYTFDGMHLLPESAEAFAKLIVPFLKEHL